MPPRVEAVLFDLGNTLVRYYDREQFPEVLECAMRDIHAHLHRRRATTVPIDLALGRARAENREAPDHRVRKIEDRIVGIFDVPPERCANVTLSRCVELFLAPVFAIARPDPEALPVLGELRDRGMRTAIVSNTPWGTPAGLWREELARHGLLDAADASVFCVETGWRKPAGPVFEKALELLGVVAGEALFVGDDPRWDVAGARAVGIRPVLLDPGGRHPEIECDRIRSLREVLDLV